MQTGQLEKPIEHKDQSFRVLGFALVHGPLNQDQFTILSNHRIQVGAVNVYSGIIGESHFVSVQNGNSVPVHEVFACVDVQEDPIVALSSPISLEHGLSSVMIPESGVGYSFTPTVVDWVDAQAQLVGLELRIRQASSEQVIGLCYDFPCNDGDNHVPKTLVHVDVGEEVVQVNTAHSYPNDEIVVFTSSEFQIFSKGESRGV